MPAITALAIGDDAFPYHRFETMGPLLAEFLEAEGISVDRTTDRDALSDLEEYDVFVDYTTDSTMTDEQLDALLSHVRSGGGYVGIHGASVLTSAVSDDSDEVSETREATIELRELIGGQFITHPEQCDLPIEITDHEHPITAPLEDFTVWDEPYDVEFDDDNRILARMNHEDLGDVPVAWTRMYGDGRVFYCSLGHDENAFENESFQELITRGVRWTVTGEAEAA